MIVLTVTASPLSNFSVRPLPRSTFYSVSFLTVPMPISRVETCRIGGNPQFVANCGGPCPNYDFRDDMKPENPAATWERGQRVTIHYSKNNHEGGFVRLTMVPIDEMNMKSVHDIMAFYFGCWSSGGYSCNDHEYHRDCGFDLDNLAWKTDITVPTIYPDGVYVLGWTWYGGGETFGSFGDYYDCSYVRIRGGPLTESHTTIFEPGPRYPDGCQSSVGKLGICVTEPCGQELWSERRIPSEFETGAPVVYRDWYEQALSRPANQIRVAESDAFGITGFEIYDTGNEQKMDVNLDDFIDMTGIQGITLVPLYFGHIDRVEWVVNGLHESWVEEAPFAISGSQPSGASTGHNFFDWHYPIFDKRVFVTAVAHSGPDRTYYSRDLYFRRYE